MNAIMRFPMTVDQFIDWADRRAASLPHDEPKWELFDGVPQMQEHEKWVHGRVKIEVMLAFRDAIARCGLALGGALDSIGVKVSEFSSYQPEVVIFPLAEIADDDRLAPNPIIVVEVLSPSSYATDLRTKAQGYANVPTIQHYLVVEPKQREIFHFRRDGKGFALPVTVTEGILRLDPPGLDLDIGRCF